MAISRKQASKIAQARSVSTLDQVVSTQCFKYKAKRSSSVDTRSSSVDTRDSFQKTFWPIWDSVSTLDQCVDTSSGSVDTSDFLRTPSGLYWDSVSTLVQVVSTLVPFQGKTYRSRVTCKHVAADTTGKKNGLVWMISCSPATKNFSTRPQQVLKLIPKFIHRE
ncbi:hypothetical protein Taro_021648 [Colocasia esculenta]|uniref:Uncharacterized protein n=1 Tax=Colocasia esculenta TaxID=4460 RepID=A0A843V8U6_COLES|nr:hypothetical protein [Colocasia esculenta]